LSSAPARPSLEPGSPARDREIDTLRGFACILLVSYHVIGATMNDGLRIDTGPLRVGEDLLAMLRMPLFTFLSGCVYARAPIGLTPAWTFLRGKARRLLVPMLVVGTIFALVHELMPGMHGWQVEWRWLHVMPVAHYWFVEALYLIFIVVLLLERGRLLSTPERWLGCWVIAAALYLTPHRIAWLAIGGATSLLPFFLLGLYCRRFGRLDSRLLAKVPDDTRAGLLICLVAGLFVAARFGGIEGTVDTPMTLLIGASACVLLLAARLRSALIAYVGAYSYTIYLFHVFFTAGSRIALTGAGVHDIRVLFALGLLAGLLLPIVTDRILARWRPTRVLALGRR
jgi:peptidoglycan/LPS O-acetylase OafA/YrhL